MTCTCFNMYDILILLLELDCIDWNYKYKLDYAFLLLIVASNSSHVHACVSGPWHSVNFTSGEVVERMMLSGMHTVADIFCCRCGQIIGWKYVILPPSSLIFTNLYFQTSVVGEIYLIIIVHLVLLILLKLHLSHRKLCRRKARSTKRESLFLKG